MAFMFRINTRCQMGNCRKLPTHRVCNRINDTVGDYCKRHAEQRLRDLQATEQLLDKRVYSEPQSPRETMERHLETFGGAKDGAR